MPEETGGQPREPDSWEGHASRRLAGYALLDPLGRRIGRVESVFAGTHGGAEYVSARIGRFGLGGSVLIPLCGAPEVDEGRRVVVLTRGRRG